MTELEPRFLVTVRLDGDDSAPVATQSVQDALEGFLAALQESRLIRAYTLVQQ